MPKPTAQGIDVSAEEERYLRRAFRRFALPYLAGLGAVAVAASLLGGSDGGGASPAALESLEEEVARLGSELAELEGRIETVDAALAQSDARVAAVEKRQKTPSSAPDTAGLERSVRNAERRLEQVEKTLSAEGAGERLDALVARMTRIERQVQAPTPAGLPPYPGTVSPSAGTVSPSAAPAP